MNTPDCYDIRTLHVLFSLDLVLLFSPTGCSPLLYRLQIATRYTSIYHVMLFTFCCVLRLVYASLVLLLLASEYFSVAKHCMFALQNAVGWYLWPGIHWFLSSCFSAVFGAEIKHKPSFTSQILIRFHCLLHVSDFVKAIIKQLKVYTKKGNLNTIHEKLQFFKIAEILILQELE